MIKSEFINQMHDVLMGIEYTLHVSNEVKVFIHCEAIIEDIKGSTISNLSINDFRISVDILSFEYYFTTCWLQYPTQHVDQSAFPSTIMTQDASHFIAFDAETNIIYCSESSKLFNQIIYFDYLIFLHIWDFELLVLNNFLDSGKNPALLFL